MERSNGPSVKPAACGVRKLSRMLPASTICERIGKRRVRSRTQRGAVSMSTGCSVWASERPRARVVRLVRDNALQSDAIDHLHGQLARGQSARYVELQASRRERLHETREFGAPPV